MRLSGLYYLLVIMVLSLILTGSIDPTLLTESLWMATWFLVGLALFLSAPNEKMLNAEARTAV